MRTALSQVILKAVELEPRIGTAPRIFVDTESFRRVAGDGSTNTDATQRWAAIATDVTPGS